MRLVDDDVDEDRAGQFLVLAGGGEVHVARHVVTGLDQRLRDEVLGAAALVGGDEVLIAVVGAHGVFEVVEVAAAGVGLVAQHHAGPLAVAHGVGAAVGEQVDVDVFGAEEEGVVAGRVKGDLAGGAVDHLDGLDHLDLPGLGPGAAAKLLAHGLWNGHGVPPCTKEIGL